MPLQSFKRLSKFFELYHFLRVFFLCHGLSLVTNPNQEQNLLKQYSKIHLIILFFFRNSLSFHRKFVNIRILLKCDKNILTSNSRLDQSKIKLIFFSKRPALISYYSHLTFKLKSLSKTPFLFFSSINHLRYS